MRALWMGAQEDLGRNLLCRAVWQRRPADSPLYCSLSPFISAPAATARQTKTTRMLMLVVAVLVVLMSILLFYQFVRFGCIDGPAP